MMNDDKLAKPITILTERIKLLENKIVHLEARIQTEIRLSEMNEKFYSQLQVQLDEVLERNEFLINESKKWGAMNHDE